MPLDVILEKVRLDIAKEMFYSQHGTAKDVDKKARTCTFVPAGDDAERLNIRFQSLIASNRGLAIIPVEGSAITVSFVNKSTGVVIATEDIDEIVYQGGENGGLVNVDPLSTSINNIETKVNAILVWAATQTPPLTLDPLILTSKTELEDEKFLH